MNLKAVFSNPRERERFLKFAVVGAIGALVDFGTFNLLMIIFSISPLLLQGFSFTAAVSSNFIWNRVWTYPDSRSKPITQQLITFFVVNIIGLGIRTLIIGWLANPFRDLFLRVDFLPLGKITGALLGVNFALGIAVVVVMFWNFFINRVWTYNDVE